VFDHLLPGIQVLLGRPFLAFTETLTKYCNRLKIIENPDTLPRMLNMSLAGQGLRCYLDSALTITVADTGSDANLMRTDYAEQRKWQVEPVSVAERYVRLPGDRIVQLSGKVRVRFDSAGGKSATCPHRAATLVSQNDRAISDPNGDSGSAQDSSSQGQSLSLTLTFYLLDTLVVDVLLGQLLLDTIDAFNFHQDSFVNFDIPEVKAFNLLGIKWASKLDNKCRALCQSASSRPDEPRQGKCGERMHVQLETDKFQ
jgi:hypothetical protein